MDPCHFEDGPVYTTNNNEITTWLHDSATYDNAYLYQMLRMEPSESKDGAYCK